MLETVEPDMGEVDALRRENHELKTQLREFEREDQQAQPSENDKLAREMVEPNIIVRENRYEIPVPIAPQVSDLVDN